MSSFQHSTLNYPILFDDDVMILEVDPSNLLSASQGQFPVINYNLICTQYNTRTTSIQ